MSSRSIVRSAVGRALRPLLVVLDRRLENLAARLELHTQNLSGQQRAELRQVDDRVRLGVAVISEHVVGIERVARRMSGSSTEHESAPGSALIALPGEALTLPPGVGSGSVTAYTPNGDGTWVATVTLSESTLRIVQLPAHPAVWPR